MSPKRNDGKSHDESRHEGVAATTPAGIASEWSQTLGQSHASQSNPSVAPPAGNSVPGGPATEYPTSIGDDNSAFIPTYPAQLPFRMPPPVPYYGTPVPNQGAYPASLFALYQARASAGMINMAPYSVFAGASAMFPPAPGFPTPGLPFLGPLQPGGGAPPMTGTGSAGSPPEVGSAPADAMRGRRRGFDEPKIKHRAKRPKRESKPSKPAPVEQEGKTKMAVERDSKQFKPAVLKWTPPSRSASGASKIVAPDHDLPKQRELKKAVLESDANVPVRSTANDEPRQVCTRVSTPKDPGTIPTKCPETETPSMPDANVVKQAPLVPEVAPIGDIVAERGSDESSLSDLSDDEKGGNAFAEGREMVLSDVSLVRPIKVESGKQLAELPLAESMQVDGPSTALPLADVVGTIEREVPSIYIEPKDERAAKLAYRHQKMARLRRRRRELRVDSSDLRKAVERSMSNRTKLSVLPFAKDAFPALTTTSAFNEAVLGQSYYGNWTSPYTGRQLKAYIRRDFESVSPKLRLLQELDKKFWRVPSMLADDAGVGEVRAQSKASEMPQFNPGYSIDYTYFHSRQLIQVNGLLSDMFWPGIDVSESVQFPDYGIVAMYRKLVVGVALCTPEGYLTYIAVMPGWTGAGIASFMLYWLCKQISPRDLTLHVSTNNVAMILYQKFGFKPEEFIVGFYDKYYPEESHESKNAFFVRLRQ